MSTLILTIDDRLKENLAVLAARSRKPLPDWAAEQLGRLVSEADAQAPASYSEEWLSTFGSITDSSFEAPTRPLPSAVEALDLK